MRSCSKRMLIWIDGVTLNYQVREYPAALGAIVKSNFRAGTVQLFVMKTVFGYEDVE